MLPQIEMPQGLMGSHSGPPIYTAKLDELPVPQEEIGTPAQDSLPRPAFLEEGPAGHKQRCVTRTRMGFAFHPISDPAEP